MTKSQFYLVIATLFCVRASSFASLAPVSTAWTPTETRPRKRMKATTNNDDSAMNQFNSISSSIRRELLQKTVQMGALTSAAPVSANTAAVKCDPGDVRCRQDGTRGDPIGKPIPTVTNKITFVVQMIVDIGERRENDAGYLRFGLYGDDCPESVKQLLLFLTKGITSMNKNTLENSVGLDYAPVTLLDGGAVPNICPGKGVDFGVPSQSKAYSRSRGLKTAGPNFIPQSRPTPSLETETFPRPHGVAGLVSIPAKGIGYGGGAANLPEDEIFSSAFTITADEVPALDKPSNSHQQQRVIGQIIDDESMQFLDRLANLPIQKKVGKSDSGPPLLKVRVRDVDFQRVKEVTQKKKKR